MTEIVKDEITTGSIEGTGVFDEFMKTIEVRLNREYDKTRIKGSDYSKVYLGAMEAAMQQSIAFALGRQQADKQAELLVKQTLKAIEETALVTSQKLKVDAEKLLVDQQTANAVLQGNVLIQEELKIKEEIKILEHKVLNDLALETAILTKQNTKLTAEIAILNEQDDKVKAEKELVAQQKTTEINKGTLITNQGFSELAKIKDIVVVPGIPGEDVSGLVGKQKLKLDAEYTLVKQKRATEEAQINDATVNWDDEVVSAIVGVVGKQKALYAKQTEGFDRDAEQKLAKILVDSWSVRRTTDEGTFVTGGMTDKDIQDVLNKAKLGIEAPEAEEPVVDNPES